MLKEFLEAGRVASTQGLKGDLRVECWCDSPQFLAAFKTLYWDNGKVPVKVQAARVHKTLAILKLEGVDTVEAGDALRGRILYIRRADVKLPKDTWFMEDLMGMEVLDADTGARYGKLTEVIKTGANDVYQVTADDGKNYLVPVIPEVLIAVELEAGIIRIRPMRGIFDDAD